MKYVFSVQARYIWLNLIDLIKKTFCLFKTESKAKKLFVKYLGMQFRRAVHIPEKDSSLLLGIYVKNTSFDLC